MSTIVNLYNKLTEGNGGVAPTTGGTWSFVGTASSYPTPPVTYNGSIDFAGYDALEDYQYKYTVVLDTCTDEKIVTVIKYDSVELPYNECAGALNFGTLTDTTSDRTLNGLSNIDDCSRFSVSMSSVSIPSEWGAGTFDGDVWFKFTLNVTAAPTDFLFSLQPIGAIPIGNGNPLNCKIALYNGTCGAEVKLDAGHFSGSTVYNFTASAPTTWANDQYFVRISSSEGTSGEFNLLLNI